MNKLSAIAVTTLMVLFAMAMTVGAANEVDVRGQVTNVGTETTSWDYKNFAGFYYDMDKNIGTEQITFKVSGVDAGKTTATLSDTEGARGIIYETTAQAKNFKFKPWGSYQIIGFLGERYFAAYNAFITQSMMNAGETATPCLYDKSKNRNLMTNEQITKILLDSDAEATISSDAPLKLAEGYELAIISINADETKARVELRKDGQVIDATMIQPGIEGATISDRTYYYKRDLGDTKEIVTIAVHFRSMMHEATRDTAIVDGLFQISDTPTSIAAGQKYAKMSIRNVDATAFTITTDNKDSQISLSKNKNAQLMQNIYIKTADQDATADDPLRYYIYKKYTEPGTYEIRGTVTDLGAEDFTWDPSTFAALYYDIDKNIGNEQIKFTLTGIDGDKSTATLSDTEWARGIIYTTTAQNKSFKFKPWGSYKKLGFLGEPYFAAYNNFVTPGMATAGETVPFIADRSKNDNLMTNEQLTKILIDSNTETTFSSDMPLKLAEGYELTNLSVNVNETKARVELRKDGQVVETMMVQPGLRGATISDKTFYYKRDLGDAKELVTIAVHFRGLMHEATRDTAVVDGIFQISDTPAPVKVDQQYAKMSIRNVDPTAFTITMDNKDKQITLSKNKVTELMAGIFIKTADQNDISADNPLRYYIFKNTTI